MRTPVWFEVSMMSRELLTRTPLKQRIRDARGDNFTKDQVMYQVSEASHPCSFPRALSWHRCASAVLQRLQDIRIFSAAPRRA